MNRLLPQKNCVNVFATRKNAGGTYSPSCGISVIHIRGASIAVLSWRYMKFARFRKPVQALINAFNMSMATFSCFSWVCMPWGWMLVGRRGKLADGYTEEKNAFFCPLCLAQPCSPLQIYEKIILLNTISRKKKNVKSKTIVSHGKFVLPCRWSVAAFAIGILVRFIASLLHFRPYPFHLLCPLCRQSWHIRGVEDVRFNCSL